jgi:hypothetical protein
VSVTAIAATAANAYEISGGPRLSSEIATADPRRSLQEIAGDQYTRRRPAIGEDACVGREQGRGISCATATSPALVALP